MEDITKISDEQLKDDLQASLDDIEICLAALSFGITHHQGGLFVHNTLINNEKIVAVIRAEQDRRLVKS